MTDENIEVLKIVIIGESSVGKTSIIAQFVDKIFQEELQSTVGGTFNSKSIKCEDKNKILKLEIWDTAGQERYRSVTRMFYKDADVAILVYDITNKNSYEELKNYWVMQVQESSQKDIMLVIVANKSDLLENEQVEEEEARNYAKSINALYFLASAKQSESINGLFMAIAKKYTGANKVSIIEENEESICDVQKIRKTSVRVTQEKIKKKKKRCC